MTRIGYTLHGHPFCLPCFDGDYHLNADGLAHAHDDQGCAADVAPIYAGDPDDGAPCAGCGHPLATPPKAAIVWTCPECGSDDLRTFYSERRTCRVGTRVGTRDDTDAAPWPSYEGDEFVDIDPTTFAFACDTCTTYDITPHTGGETDALHHRQAA